MKKIRITLTQIVTDEYYEKEVKELKDDIDSGKFQKGFLKDRKGILKSSARFEIVRE